MNLRAALYTLATLAPPAIAIDDRYCGTPSLQYDYRGTLATSKSGHTCQYWTSQSPNSHSNTPERRKDKGLGEHNYCRNPDGEPQGAWCYTTTPGVRWEYCGVPDCDAYAPAATVSVDISPEAGALITPDIISEKYSASTVGVCANAANGEAVDKVQRDGIYSANAEAPGICYNLCAPFFDAPGFVGMQWRDVSFGSRCICYFDDGTVPEVLPAGADVQTIGTSVGPVTGKSYADHYCYPFKGYMDANRRAIYGNPDLLADYVNFEIYGSAKRIANAEVQYDQNQNHIDKISPTFAADHSSISASGNAWSAYLLPEEVEIHDDSVLQFNFTLNEDTVDGFQAVCLDYDTEETGSNGKCFVLRSSQGWIQHMVNVPTQTVIGQTSVHSIPVGDFFVGTVNYIAFLQDSDGGDRTKGGSSISGLKLLSLENEHLAIEIDDTVEYLRNDQISFKNNGLDNQDTKDYWMHLSEDGKSVQINGNQWKAMPLNAPYDITADTILEFDIVVNQSVDFHAICLNDKPDMVLGNNCVVVQNPKESAGNLYHITTKLVTGESKRVVIPFGTFMNLKEGETSTVNYIAFIQDNDTSGARHGGRSTWSNLRLYHESRAPIVMSVFGSDVSVANIQEPLQNDSGDVQDSRDHIMSVSADGRTITATSNSWKMLRLPSNFVVTPATVLKFNFALQQESELHAICLLDEIRIKDGRNDCFFTAGSQDHASNQGQKVEPYTAEGHSRDYEIQVGSYFEGLVKYVGIIVDNDLGFTPGDVERTLGQSSWSNIEIYNLPTLDISVDGSTVSIDNHQISYDQGQDNTPIRDHMAIIDGPSIQFQGNMWRALELPTPLDIADKQDFILSFDFELREAAEIHAICFEEDRELGDGNNPGNGNPKRCIATAFFQDDNKEDYIMADYQTRVGETHHYVLDLKELFHRMYYGPIKYIAFVHDNDADRSAGDSTYSNITISTSKGTSRSSPSTCLVTKSTYAFDLSDCTVENFLSKIGEELAAINCANQDPLMELMATFGATQESDVYHQIEKICTSAYKLDQYDFADNQLGTDRATERQLVKEYIDGGTVMNYETANSAARNIVDVETIASSKLLSWPKHHALDSCDVGAAMCCFVSSRENPERVDNSDVCYVDMKASKRTAHVQDGWSIYGNDSDDVYCEGFAWGKDGGSISNALKGNALFHVGFADMYGTGDVEQVPGAPLCGCMDRMPVVTNAACTSATSANSSVTVTWTRSGGKFRATFNAGDIQYGNCGNLVDHYETLVGAGVDLDYMKERVVGNGGCGAAINRFLSKKGLVKA